MSEAMWDVTRCRRFTEDVAMHWFPPYAVPGDACWCSETVMRDEPDLDDQRDVDAGTDEDELRDETCRLDGD